MALNIEDPREDLENDSFYWKLLLGAANTLSEELYFSLHGFRCMGTLIKYDEDRIKFAYDEDNWQNLNMDLKKYRDEFLTPEQDVLIKLFNWTAKKIKERENT